MLLSGLSLLLTALTQPAFNSGTDRGVFVYGHVVLDFQMQSEVMGRTHRLRNCSTEALYCANGELFNIVLPRFCPSPGIRPGAAWRQGELETTVIGEERVEVVGHAPPGTSYPLYYLQTNVRPDIVFAYSPGRGVMGFYYDLRREFRPAEAVDFVPLARRGALRAFSRTEEARARNLYLALITLDQFATCIAR